MTCLGFNIIAEQIRKLSTQLFVQKMSLTECKTTVTTPQNQV